MQALKKGDRDSYLDQEKAIRENAGLPPYGRLAAIIVSGSEAHETERFAKHLGTDRADGGRHHPAGAGAGADRTRARQAPLALPHQSQARGECAGFLRLWLKDVKPKGSLALQVDVDPYSFL